MWAEHQKVFGLYLLVVVGCFKALKGKRWTHVSMEMWLSWTFMYLRLYSTLWDENE